MTREKLSRRCKGRARLITPLALGLMLAAAMLVWARPADTPPHNPWKSSQIVEPAELAAVLARRGAEKPAVVCTGFDFLYRSAHIPGAAYAGPARDAKGLEALRKWAAPIPRHREIVLYCGCCPLRECPNVRPAFKALQAMGFTKVAVLDLRNSFKADWLAKGYPIRKN